MVGASFALALAGTRLRTVLVESVAPTSHAQPSFDERTTALGNASRRIFQALGVWDRIAAEAAAIRAIHVSDAGRFGFARLDAREQGVEAFGYVVPNRVLGAALWKRIGACPGIVTKMPATVEAIEIGAAEVRLRIARDGRQESLAARLAVAADGAQSKVREAAGIDARIKEYGQIALVAPLQADRPHDGTAYERFTESGPMALLPLHDGSYTVVWARSPHDAEEALRLDDAAFLRQLQARFGWRAGRFVRVGRRGTYRLALSRAAAAVGQRSVLIGNAAQALHPVAGQGFNLGLRDAAALAEVLAGESSAANASAGAGTAGPEGASASSGTRADPGSPQVLARYAKQRAADRRRVVGFTDGLVRLFGDSRGAVGLARNAGLLLFDLLPPAKSALARVSLGFGGRTPRLARGLPLT
ncbi:MAG: FAD-dependent monooxygenase, partial [Steroidobacteraceae bacterium]